MLGIGNRDVVEAIDAYWRAANYLTVGQIYLQDNPLLSEPLRPEHIKPRLLGHWGTSPGVSLIYVRDLVELMILALESEAAAGETYFATGGATTYTEIARLLARVLDKRTLRVTVPLIALEPIVLVAKVQERLTGKPALLNEQRVLNMRQPYLICSGEKARRELGFAPACDLEAAVVETANWYREHGWL